MMDAAQESKGSTENAEDSDDPDLNNYHNSNEKRKGRFLIEEIEEENQINNELDHLEDFIDNEIRSHSFNLKKYNFAINTIEYFGEVQDDLINQTRNNMRAFIFDNKTNNFIPSENVLTKIKNPKILYNYVDLYPHVYCEDDCVDCYNEVECNCYDKIEGEVKPLEDNKFRMKLCEDNNVAESEKESQEKISEEITMKDKPEKKITITEEEDKKMEVNLIPNTTEKLWKFPKFDKNKLSRSQFNSNNSFKNEYQLLSAPIKRNNLNSPYSCKVHSGKLVKYKFKRYYSSEINFSLVNFKDLKEDKNLKNLFLRDLTPITKLKNRTQSQSQINPIAFRAYRSAASVKNIKLIRNSSKFKFNCTENVAKKKFSYTKNIFSKRHYSADFPCTFKEENMKRESKNGSDGKNLSLVIHEENFEIGGVSYSEADCKVNLISGSQILNPSGKTLKIENNISFSYMNSEKICLNCSNK